MKNKLKIYLPFAILILLILVLPMIVMVISSFQSATTNSFTLDNYASMFTNKYYLKAITNSLFISLMASIVSIIVSVIGAWALTKLSEKVKNVLVTVFNMAASFAGVPLAFSLIILFGNSGVLKAITVAIGIQDILNIYSLPGLVLSYTFFEIPLGIMFLFPAFNSIDPEWEKASEILGANKSFYVFNVVFPLTFPNIIQVFILLFANAMGTYETVYALTGNNIVSVPTLIGSFINGEIVPNIPMACAFATIFAVFMLIVVKLGNTITNRKGGAR